MRTGKKNFNWTNMSILNDINNIPSSRKELKSFGLTIGIVLIFIGGLNLWRHRSQGVYFLGAGALLMLLGFVAPTMLKPFQKSWMALALLMGWVMTRVILCLLFYVVVTPIALFAQGVRRRFFGKDKQALQSHWIAREGDPADKSRYEKQF